MINLNVTSDRFTLDPIDLVGRNPGLVRATQRSVVNDGEVGDIEEIFNQAGRTSRRWVWATDDGAEGGIEGFGKGGKDVRLRAQRNPDQTGIFPAWKGFRTGLRWWGLRRMGGHVDALTAFVISPTVVGATELAVRENLS